MEFSESRPVGIFDSFVTRSWFSQASRVIWTDVGTLSAWLEVEVALAQAQASLQMIPAEAAVQIREKAVAGSFDLERLARDSAFMGHPFVPALRQLEELCGEPAAGYLHLGATTQNIFDTATALQMSRTHRLIDAALQRAAVSLAGLANEHKATLQAGRTHGQHALPMTFGFKVAGWLVELDRDHQRLNERSRTAFLALMGGAIGTYAAMEPHGRHVEELVAGLLGLTPAGLASRSSFDRMADYVSALGLLAGTAQRISADIYFMQRNEVAEAEESFHHGKIGSSTMAQKRNPVLAGMIVTLSRMLRSRVALCQEAMARADEADTTTSSISEMTLPEVGMVGVAIAEGLANLITGIRVYPDAMGRNLRISRGLINAEAAMMCLAPAIGRHQAHELLYDAAQEAFARGVALEDILSVHPVVKEYNLASALKVALQPENYTGQSESLATEVSRRVLLTYRSGGGHEASER